MNDRIKELAYQVGFDLCREEDQNMLQEFAELIVEECIKNINQHFGIKEIKLNV